MLLKINKEGPYKKDVFRAPGHQGNTRKLIHFLQQGKMVFFVGNGICVQNCSDLLWEKIVLVIEKNFWNLRLKAENWQYM